MMQIYEKWLFLKKSEKAMIGYGLLCVAATALYFYIWKPYDQKMEFYQQQTRAVQNDINWLIQVNSEVKKLRTLSNDSVGTFKGSMINTVDKSLKQNQIDKTVSLLENSGNDNVVVQFNQINFNELLKWIGYLKKRYGILVKNIDVTKESETALVNARVILKKS